jgi:hypothetical protein
MCGNSSPNCSTPTLATWKMRWTVHDADGVEVERREASTQWAVVGPEKVKKAALAVGLEASGEGLDASMFSFRQPR